MSEFVLHTPFQVAVITQIRTELAEMVPDEKFTGLAIAEDIRATTGWIEHPRSGYLFS